jgi:hypothetical protein
MMSLIQAIQQKEPLETISRLANQRKNHTRPHAKSAMDQILKQVHYNPSFIPQMSLENDYARRVIHILLDHQVDVTTIHNVEALSYVVDPPLLRKLLDHGFPVDLQDEDGCTLLVMLFILYPLLHFYRQNARERAFQQAVRSTEEMIMILLEKGADVALSLHNEEVFEEINGGTALHVLMNSNITPFLFDLFRRIATPDVINVPANSGITPLMRYVMVREEEADRVPDDVPYSVMIDAFMTAGADLLMRDHEGRSALDHAVANGNMELATILRQKEKQVRESLQGALLSRTRSRSRYGITPGIAKRITNFLGGKRKTRKGKKSRKSGKPKKAKTRRA